MAKMFAEAVDRFFPVSPLPIFLHSVQVMQWMTDTSEMVAFHSSLV